MLMVVGWAAGYNTVSRMLRVWVVLHAECRSTDTNGAGGVGTTIADMSKRDDRWRAAPGRARRENVAAAPCATAATASRDSVVTAILPTPDALCWRTNGSLLRRMPTPGEKANALWCRWRRQVHAQRPRVWARLGFDAGRLGFRIRAPPRHPDLSGQRPGDRRGARHHRLPCARRESAHTVGQVASPGACSVAARVSKARVRRRQARIPNPSLQPRDPDLATIRRRPTLRSPP